ncbi:unnamed protein product [Leptosia nina]|uniref:Large ribosomal subunit protein bL21m n=1 Tax=Leptosia nina TaxID=320188 RepID=A0AAV1JX15_9NEOP
MAFLRSGWQKIATVFGSNNGGLLSRFLTSNIPSVNKPLIDTNQDIISTCNKLIEDKSSRNFAIVHLLASKDFSLIGRPVVQPGLVTVTATIISKGLAHTKIHFKKKRRKQFMRINFQRPQQTMLRINSVVINNTINEAPKNEF